MKKLSKGADGKYELVDASILDGTLSSFTNVITGNPNTQFQSIVLGLSSFAAGVATSALVFSRDKKKFAWYANLASDEAAKNV